MKKPVILALALAVIAPVTVHAVTISSDRALFEAQLSNLVIDDYSAAGYASGDRSDGTTLDIHSDGNMSSILGETSYSSTGFNNLNIISRSGANPFYCAGCNGSFLLDFSTTSVGTSDGVFGAGFNFYNASSTNSYVAFVSFGDGTTQNVALDPIGFGSDFGGFFGITSNSLISSVHLGLVDGGSTQDGSFGIDNLTIGSSIDVPAPGTLALIGVGFICMGFARRRKTL